MKAVYGLYAEPELAQRAVANLRAAGVADADITVISSEPFEHFEFGHRDAHTIMPWMAVVGGLVGMTTGYLLTSVTQMAWPVSVPCFTTGVVGSGSSPTRERVGFW